MMNTFNRDGFRTIDLELQENEIRRMRTHWRKFVKSIPPYPGKYEGKGIVICAGGFSYLTCCWILLKSLKDVECELPIEVWHLGDELSGEIKMELNAQGVTCKDFIDYGVSDINSGYMLKPLAIKLSSFKEILFLDADNFCLNNPEQLFAEPQYLQKGTIFWPDFWKTHRENPMWKIIDTEYIFENEQESGQILINKEKCWKELNLCIYLNEHSYVYYHLIHGDKDTFRFAWKALNTEYFMINDEPSSCGYLDLSGNFKGITMAQHDPNGDIIFLHRNLLKWDVTKSSEKVWTTIRKFRNKSGSRFYEISNSSNGHVFMDLHGDIEENSFIDSYGNLEENCLIHLKELREKDSYRSFSLTSWIYKMRIVDKGRWKL